MSARGPKPGTKTKTDFVAKAHAAWGAALPDWVLALAEQANATTGTAAAAKIGYSGAVVTQVVGKKYPGDLERVAGKVRGALMGVAVTCPIIGEIGRDRCLDEQRKPFAGTSSIRSKLFHACRSGCPHSRLTQKPERPDAQ